MMIGKRSFPRAVFRTLFGVGDLNDDDNETDVTSLSPSDALCVHYPDIYISDGRISPLISLGSLKVVVSLSLSSAIHNQYV